MYSFLFCFNECIFRLKTEHFTEATKEIISLFPGELKETYFIPYTSHKTGLRQPARGKLWSRYVNVKAALRVANQNIIKQDPPIVCEVNAEEDADLVFLHTATEPYPRILQAWERTVEIRKRMYRDCKIEKIFQDFPCLKTEYGIQLVSFYSWHNMKISDCWKCFYSLWKNFYYFL